MCCRTQSWSEFRKVEREFGAGMNFAQSVGLL
jgi:hypothetical protein